MFLFSAALGVGLGSAGSATAQATVVLAEAKGDVQVRAPDAAGFAPASAGAKLVDGARLKTGAGATASLRYPDGSQARVHAASEVIVRASTTPAQKPSGLVVFLGRVWSKVAKSSTGEQHFEVRSANAVAGVRGTEFEVGVGLDGSARVEVSEGRVAVTGDDGERDSEVGGGYALVSNESGKLGRVGKTRGRFDWEGWFSERARAMEKRGLAVAKSLDGRLNRRKAKLEKLLAEQKSLRQRIQRLEKAKAEGDEVEGELRSTLAKLVKTTRRIEDMRARLEGAFGLFERWGQVAGGGGIADADAIAAMAGDVAKIAADFADMIEEGTDLSQEGMDDMMKDMGEGKRMGPGDSAADELLR